jgi:hypothetical protein
MARKLAAPATEAGALFALEPILGTLQLPRRNKWLLGLENRRTFAGMSAMAAVWFPGAGKTLR